MLFTDSVYIGVDMNSGHKALTYAALDHDLNLVALADAEAEEVLAFLAAQKSAMVAVNAPSDVNHGVVKKNLKNESLTAHSVRGTEMRVAEYELRQRRNRHPRNGCEGIAVPGRSPRGIRFL